MSEDDGVFLDEEQRKGYEEQTKGNKECLVCDHPMLDATERLKVQAEEAYICHPCGLAFLRPFGETEFVALPARCKTMQ